MSYICGACGCRTMSINIHTTKCPVLQRQRYIVAMDRGDGCIVYKKQWARMSRTHGLLSVTGLRDSLHTMQWGKIAEFFGLKLPPNKERAASAKSGLSAVERNALRSALDAPLTDAKRHACTLRGGDEFAATQGVHSRWNVVDVWR